jgi:hypothetical protein
VAIVSVSVTAALPGGIVVLAAIPFDVTVANVADAVVLVVIEAVDGFDTARFFGGGGVEPPPQAARIAATRNAASGTLVERKRIGMGPETSQGTSGESPLPL